MSTRLCASLKRPGLVAFEAGATQVTAADWFLVRAFAMVFHRHLQAAKERHGSSGVV